MPSAFTPKAKSSLDRGEEQISTSEYRVNRAIRTKEVRLIDADGENRGVVSIEEALRIAQEAGLDLIEVSPNAKPPVCRVVEFGKFTYERTKKEREARKAQKKVEVKEIRLRPKTTEHHRGFKVRAARGWLKEGKKVKVRIRFRGRERDYPEIALEDLKEIAAELQDLSIIEQVPEFEGRTLLMVLAPSDGSASPATAKTMPAKAPETKPQAAKPETTAPKK